MIHSARPIVRFSFNYEKWAQTDNVRIILVITTDHYCCSAEWIKKIRGKKRTNKTGVINDPLVQTHSHASSEHCCLFCFSRFDKWGRTYVRTYGQHVRKQLSLPAVTLGWPSGSINQISYANCRVKVMLVK